MAIRMIETPTRTQEATVEDLYRTEGKAEIVNGKLAHMSPTGFLPGRAGHIICSSLREVESQAGGWAIPDNVAFIVNLPHRKSFSPDSAFFVGAPSGMKFLAGAPVFAVEVRSEEDYGRRAEKRLAQKRADYFAAGTLIVWDVDLQSPDVIKAYHASDPATPTIYRRGDTADAEPAVPGWRFKVDELFGAHHTA